MRSELTGGTKAKPSWQPLYFSTEQQPLPNFLGQSSLRDSMYTLRCALASIAGGSSAEFAHSAPMTMSAFNMTVHVDSNSELAASSASLYLRIKSPNAARKKRCCTSFGAPGCVFQAWKAAQEGFVVAASRILRDFQ
jgi:hypothetical protein